MTHGPLLVNAVRAAAPAKRMGPGVG